MEEQSDKYEKERIGICQSIPVEDAGCHLPTCILPQPKGP